MRQRDREYVLTDSELAKHAHSFPGAWEVLNKCIAIREVGGRPVVYHSRRNGYRGVDELAVRMRSYE